MRPKKTIYDVALYTNRRLKSTPDNPSVYLVECFNSTPKGSTELLLTRNAVIAMRTRCNSILDEAYDEIESELAELEYTIEENK